MNNKLRIFSIYILPIVILVLFVIIGAINEQLIFAREGSHRTMSGGVAFQAWSLRGVYGAILIYTFSKFILYSEISKSRKIIVFSLILILNIPFMYFMEIVIFFPMGLLIIPVINVTVFFSVKVLFVKTNAS